MTLAFTLEQIEEMMEDSGGFCTHCGAETYNVGPDARKYACEACGSRAVYGAEELLMMGLVK